MRMASLGAGLSLGCSASRPAPPSVLGRLPPAWGAGEFQLPVSPALAAAAVAEVNQWMRDVLLSLC